ncbi:DUF4194 domain-containing protein [Roseateles saccharophilus]|uniref:Uncharacterized protein DUF4194 n=1 Tax=Roseateles saccharophilus TaxID=304 RepID=A0A4R3U933_ROSSA|nr:DUF4194 domain-containing protein [Roseateles saccharophilus]MDG0835791.1 DUF4194 domain-containing protein [Roseateles saccharophilus]TCU83743.1 uncharacterized protein DUF4194 [Roseateles saccharophilus]
MTAETFQALLENRLAERTAGGVPRRRFAEICNRLLAAGILWRDYSKPEQALYDDATLVEELLREWFDVLGFALTHDVDANLMRLYPPGDDQEDEDGVKRLRARLSKDVVAAALGLRFLYTEALTGKRELINQELAISLEELSQTLVTLLGTTLPASTAERVQLMRELRKHRLVRFREGDAGFGQMEMLLSVLRPILSFVSDEALLEVRQLMQQRSA